MCMYGFRENNNGCMTCECKTSACEGQQCDQGQVCREKQLTCPDGALCPVRAECKTATPSGKYPSSLTVFGYLLVIAAYWSRGVL